MSMEIDLGDEVKITVKISGKNYVLREPTMDDVNMMSKIDKADPVGANTVFKKFVIGLGMPEDVVNALGVLRLKRLTEGLTGALDVKK